MRQTTCVVVDDEPIARRGIERYISTIEGLVCIGSFGNVTQLDRFLHSADPEDEPDIIFIDIRMPGMSGLDYLAANRVRSAVIIVTAYESYALQGYELDVTDYLLKPVSLERFLKAVRKAVAYRESLASDRLSTGQTSISLADSIFVKSDRIIHRIILSDIIYIEGMENYVKIFTASGMTVARSTLKGLMSSLRADFFMQTHKSYIINIRHLRSIDGNMIRLTSAHTVPLAKTARPDLLRRLSL